MEISCLDHLVLTVKDLEATVDFYQIVLGMSPVRFGQGRTALAFGRQKINLPEAGREFGPKALCPQPGSADLCFITETPLDQVAAQLACQGVGIEDGPVERTGAAGAILSLYIRDPDGNLIELSNYL